MRMVHVILSCCACHMLTNFPALTFKCQCQQACRSLSAAFHQVVVRGRLGCGGAAARGADTPARCNTNWCADLGIPHAGSGAVHS